jgi:hypothetical protein
MKNAFKCTNLLKRDRLCVLHFGQATINLKW